MAKTTLFKGVVYLSDDNYAKLVKDGVIEVGGQTVTYDESMVYVTPKTFGGNYYTKEEVEEKLKTVFDNVTYLDNSYGEQSVIYDTDDGITIMQTTRITQGDKTNDISSELTIPLVGSDEIVFDATEDGSHVQAHLDMDITNKLARTLVTPVSRPTNTELVAVDSTGSQTMLELGDGLSISNGKLNAAGGGSSGGGSKLYRHNLQFYLAPMEGISAYLYATITTETSDVFTEQSLIEYLQAREGIRIPFTGVMAIGSAMALFNNFYASDNQIQFDGSNVIYSVVGNNITIQTSTFAQSFGTNILQTDTVSEF